MTDIKMSEVFENLPTTPDKFWLSSDPEIRRKQMQALVHAINQHDKLAEENERMRAELDKLKNIAEWAHKTVKSRGGDTHDDDEMDVATVEIGEIVYLECALLEAGYDV